MGKEEGEAAGRHCHNTVFITMLLYFFLFRSLFVSFSSFVYLFVFFFFSILGNSFNMDGISYYITCLFVVTKYYYCTIISAQVQINSKGHCSRPAALSYDNEQLQGYKEMVSPVIVERKLKEKVTYTHI